MVLHKFSHQCSRCFCSPVQRSAQVASFKSLAATRVVLWHLWIRTGHCCLPASLGDCPLRYPLARRFDCHHLWLGIQKTINLKCPLRQFFSRTRTQKHGPQSTNPPSCLCINHCHHGQSHSGPTGQSQRPRSFDVLQISSNRAQERVPNVFLGGETRCCRKSG